MKNTNSCGLLIKQIHTTVEKNANNALRADGLTSAQAAVLMTLDGQREHCITLKELEKTLLLAQSTIDGTVARLEAMGAAVSSLIVNVSRQGLVYIPALK